MSSVLHPVGPEPEERYWVRRIAVLAGAVVALVVIVALVLHATSAGSAVQAEPAAQPPVVPATVPGTTSPSPTPVQASASPTPSGSVTPAAATPSSGPTVTPDPTTTPRPSTTPAPGKSTAAKKATTSEKKAATKKKAVPALAACPTAQLRSTLTGKPKLKTKTSATFTLSLINGSTSPCYLRLTGGNFTLTVVSGKDRIWTTADCPTTVPALSRKLAPEQAVQWKVVWNGKRSREGCKSRPEVPKAGTYWAIAQFDDAKAVRLRMVLHG